jgi:hypothetical protein
MKWVLGMNVPPSLGFKVSSCCGTSEHECEHVMEVQLVGMLQQGAFPASLLIWVGIVCDGLVDCSAVLNTLRKK